MNEQEKTLNINWDFILKAASLVIFLYFLYLIKDLVIWFIFALVLAILFNYPIDFLERKKIPRVLAAGIVYLGVLAIVGLFFYKTAPIFLAEIKQFTANLPLYLEKLSPYFEKVGIRVLQDKDSLPALLENNLEKIGGNVLNALIVIFGGLQAAVFMIFLSFFFSLEKDFLERLSANFAPERYKEYLFKLLPRVRRRVNGWFAARLIGIIFVGLLSYVVLLILNVKYALLLGIAAGVLDFIPIIGPLIAGAIITLIVAISSLGQGLFALTAFIIIQQLENSLVMPFIFKKFAGIPPVLVLLALAIGGTLWGFLGAILAVPLAGIIFEGVKDYLILKKQRTETANI